MPRFVILRHDPGPNSDRPLHWDLMLEGESGLLTWALFVEPTLDCDIHATRLDDHRRCYLDYEGPLSRGRGTVTQWDSGSFAWECQETERAIALLEGFKQTCRITLVRDSRNVQRWTVRFALN